MAQTPIYSAKEEQRLMTELWSPDIADDPEAFVMFCYPWGKENTPLAKRTGPRKWQREILQELRDHIKKNNGKLDHAFYEALKDATCSGRGIGKSALVSWLSHWNATCHIGSTTRVSANSENQLRSVTWAEMGKWLAMAINKHWFEMSATKITPAKWLSDLVERDLKKGTRYWAIEGVLWSEENPDGFAGPHNEDGMMIIFDEASGIADGIWDVASGFFTEPVLHRYWFAFSNGRRNQGYFYECFNSKRNFWRTRNVDARTVEDTDPAVYQQIIDEHGVDSRQAKVEVYGQFPSQGDDQFIDSGVVDACIGRQPMNDKDAPIVVGVDVARFGSDKTVICVRKGRDIVTLIKAAGLDTMQVVGKVIEVMGKYKPILTIIDEGGLGAGVLDRLLEQQYKVRGVNFGSKADSATYGNKRAEMWGLMREWLKTAILPNDRELRADLIGPTYKLNSMGAIMLERKEDMKRRGAASPDSADAIAITFAYPVSWGTSSRAIKYPNLGVV